MQLKDGKRFFALNTDDHPSQMVEGDVSDALNIRMGSSDSQHESGIAETLQGELGVLINPDSLITYYGSAIGGQFVYSGYQECKIGTQVWMKKNWDANYPGSKVYGDDENNRDVYGGLYTHGQIMASDFCPDGWHVPTEAEVDILIAELLGAAVAGGKLKDIGWWDAPNTGADDSSGFKAMPGGGFGMDVMYYGSAIGSDNVYDLLGSTGLLWLADEVPDTVPDTVPVTYNDYFLPSRDELNAMWNELVLHGIGGFVTDMFSYYWSSTEQNNATQGIAQTFFTGTDGAFTKNTLLYVRACRSFTSTTNYNLRDLGPAGGYIFWKSGNDYLEAAPTDQSVSQAWSNIDSVEIGATAQGTAVGTGQANTTAIMNQVGHTNSAAKLCNDLVIIN